MAEIKFLAKTMETYVCSDFRAEKGDSFEVDNNKLDQLLTDFPKDFELMKPFRLDMEQEKTTKRSKS